MKEFWKYDSEVRALINHTIQGTAADMLKFSLVNITKSLAQKGLDAYPINHTHDEIAIENKQHEEVGPIMKNVMEMTIDGIFMPIDIEKKNSWSKA